MTTRSTTAVTVNRRFAAPPERVFDAWLDPAQARRFLFATPGGEMGKVEIAPRVGGGFHIVERRGGRDADHFGRYLEIDRPRRLVFELWLDPRPTHVDRVVVEVVPVATGCELTLTHELAAEWSDVADRTASGWSAILDGLESVSSS